MNIQEIITLIRSGSSNPDHHEGQEQIEETVGLLETLQSVDGLLFSQRYKLSKILGCKCCYDDIEKAAKELLEKMQAVGQWQPIATAPKDGKEIIVYDSDLSVLTAYYIDDRWTNPCDRDEYYDAVTHWMPWPEPPAST